MSSKEKVEEFYRRKKEIEDYQASQKDIASKPITVVPKKIPGQSKIDDWI